MFDIDFFQQMLIISITLSTITCSLIQKIKGFLKSSKYIMLVSFLINIIIGIFFSISFTNISFPNSLWIGVLSFLGADSIYKALEGKLDSFSDILIRKQKK